VPETRSRLHILLALTGARPAPETNLAVLSSHLACSECLHHRQSRLEVGEGSVGSESTCQMDAEPSFFLRQFSPGQLDRPHNDVVGEPYRAVGVAARTVAIVPRIAVRGPLRPASSVVTILQSRSLRVAATLF
jgi:hypothetical protein